MELMDIVLILVSIVVGMLSYFFSRLAGDLRELEDKMTECQTHMPERYVMKTDYHRDIDEIKSMLSDIFEILRGGK